MDLGAPELLVILGVVILLFGVGRIGQLGGELGRAIREFRKGLQGEPRTDDPPPPEPPDDPPPPAE